MLLAFSPLYSFSFFLTLFLSFPFVSVHHDGKISGFIRKKKKRQSKTQNSSPLQKRNVQTMPNGFFAFRSLSQGLLLTSLPKQTARLAT